jgi:hypothetical protein
VAARRATEVFASGEAARHVERALVVQDLIAGDDLAKRCDLLLAPGEALFPAGENERVIADVAPEALKLADSLGDRRRAFRACRLALDCLYAQGVVTAASQPEYLKWAETAARNAQPDSSERTDAALALASALGTHGRRQEARTLQRDALALSRRTADPQAMFTAAYWLIGSAYTAPQHWEDQLRLAEECASWPREGVGNQTLGQVLWHCDCVQLGRSERAQSEDLWRQVEELADRTHVATTSLYVAQRDAILAVVDGHLENALALIRRYVEHADEAGAHVRGRQIGALTLRAPALYMGRADIYLSAYEDYARLVPAASRSRSALVLTLTVARAMCIALLGQVEQARALAGPLLADIEQGLIDDEAGSTLFAILLPAAVALDRHAAAQALSARLACVAHLAMQNVGSSICMCVARHLGDAATLLGDKTSARAYYMQALEATTRIGFRPAWALLS